MYSWHEDGYWVTFRQCLMSWRLVSWHIEPNILLHATAGGGEHAGYLLWASRCHWLERYCHWVCLAWRLFSRPWMHSRDQVLHSLTATLILCVGKYKVLDCAIDCARLKWHKTILILMKLYARIVRFCNSPPTAWKVLLPFYLVP